MKKLELPKRKQKLVRVQALIPQDVHAKAKLKMKEKGWLINDVVKAAFDLFIAQE